MRSYTSDVQRRPTAAIALTLALACGDNSTKTTSSSSDVSTGSTATSDTSSSSGSALPDVSIVVEGWGEIAEHSCGFLDRECYAQTACEAVTQTECVFSEWDCYDAVEGENGSYYPSYAEGPEEINFAIHSVNVDLFGNICSCDKAALEELGLSTIYEPCGYGQWRPKILD